MENLTTHGSRASMAIFAASLTTLLLLSIGAVPMVSAAGNVTVYPFPEGLPSAYMSPDYTVTVEDHDVPIYSAGTNSWGQRVSYGYFEMTGSVDVAITVASEFGEYKLVPQSLGIEGERSGNTITFNLDRPTNISLVLDGNYHGKILHLFAQPPETGVPDPNDSSVLYFGPGYHDLGGPGSKPIVLQSGQTLYIAGGAVVRGRVRANNASNVTIKGRGILLNDHVADDEHGNITLALNYVSHSKIEDIIVNNNTSHWTAAVHGSSFVDVLNYKAVSPRFPSSDGFVISSSHDITVDGAFIHSADDAVAIKGLSDKSNPALAPPIYNITFRNAQLWADANNAMGIGAETVAAYIKDITFENIDVLYNFDDPNHPDVLPDRSAINIFALNGTHFSDINFRDIRVEKAKRLINVHMDDSFYFGSLLGDWSWPGEMTGIRYENITSYSDGSNEIKLWGWDDEHVISDVTFDTIEINGALVEDFDDPHFRINGFVKDLHLMVPGAEPRVYTGEEYRQMVFDAAADMKTVQGWNGWYYRVWDSVNGKQDMVWNSDGSKHWRGPNMWDAIWNEPGAVFLHPDNNIVMLEWVAPRDGEVRITGRVRKSALGGGDGIMASIWKNDEHVWPAAAEWQVVEYNDPFGTRHDFSLNVSSGDIISFRIHQRGDTAFDTTAWDPVITYLE